MYGTIMRGRIKAGHRETLESLLMGWPDQRGDPDGYHSSGLAWEDRDPERLVLVVHFRNTRPATSPTPRARNRTPSTSACSNSWTGSRNGSTSITRRTRGRASPRRSLRPRRQSQKLARDLRLCWWAQRIQRICTLTSSV
jgi:hypothetical protein